MRRITADDGIDLLIAAGVPVKVKTFSDVTLGGRNASILVRQSPPSPSSARAQLEAGVTLYVVPRLTDSLRSLALSDPRIAVAAINDAIVIVEGEEQRAMNASPVMKSSGDSSRKVAWGRLAVLRALARTRAPRTQMQLAEETGVTQAAVSQSLKQLPHLVAKSGGGWAARDVREVARVFLLEYPVGRGIRRYWYSLESVNRQSERALDIGANANPILSGDVGADRIAPWRVPTMAVVYGQTGVDLAPGGFGESDSDHGTLEYVVPADHTIWATATAYADRRRPQTADPLVCVHDILRIGGPDAQEAADKVIDHLAQQWARG